MYKNALSNKQEQKLKDFLYFMKGSGGLEGLPFLRETKSNMINAGIIKSFDDVVTLEDIYKFRKIVPNNRIISFTKNNKKANKYIVDLLNKTPIIAAGVIGGISLLDFSKGGELPKFQPGGAKKGINKITSFFKKPTPIIPPIRPLPIIPSSTGIPSKLYNENFYGSHFDIANPSTLKYDAIENMYNHPVKLEDYINEGVRLDDLLQQGNIDLNATTIDILPELSKRSRVLANIKDLSGNTISRLPYYTSTGSGGKGEFLDIGNWFGYPGHMQMQPGKSKDWFIKGTKEDITGGYGNFHNMMQDMIDPMILEQHGVNKYMTGFKHSDEVTGEFYNPLIDGPRFEHDFKTLDKLKKLYTDRGLDLNRPEWKWKEGGDLPKFQPGGDKIVKSILPRLFAPNTWKKPVINYNFPLINELGLGASNLVNSTRFDVNTLNQINQVQAIDGSSNFPLLLNNYPLINTDPEFIKQFGDMASFNPEADFIISNYVNKMAGIHPELSYAMKHNPNIKTFSDPDLSWSEFVKNQNSYREGEGLIIQNLEGWDPVNQRGVELTYNVNEGIMPNVDPIHQTGRFRGHPNRGVNQHNHLLGMTGSFPSIIASGDRMFTSTGKQRWGERTAKHLANDWDYPGRPVTQDWIDKLLGQKKSSNWMSGSPKLANRLDQSFGINIPLQNKVFMKFIHPKRKLGGEYMDLDLTEEQIQNFKDGGFVVDELPRAQFGYNSINQDTVKTINNLFKSNENKNFLIDMANSPLFGDRYKKMSGNPDLTEEAIEEHRKSIIDNTNTTGVKHKTDFDKGVEAFYSPPLNEIIKQFAYEQGISESELTESELLKLHDKYARNYDQGHTINVDYGENFDSWDDLHERSHSSTYGDFDLKTDPFNSIGVMNEYGKENNSFNKFLYLNQPTEQKARIDVIRKFMNDYNLYDPINEEFNEDHYKKLKRHRRAINDNSSLKRQINDIYHDYDKDTVIKMMNSFVQNDSPQSAGYIPTAQSGGQLNKFQNGGGYDPNMSLDKYLDYVGRPVKNKLNFDNKTDIEDKMQELKEKYPSAFQPFKFKSGIFDELERKRLIEKYDIDGDGNLSKKEIENYKLDLIKKENPEDYKDYIAFKKKLQKNTNPDKLNAKRNTEELGKYKGKSTYIYEGSFDDAYNLARYHAGEGLLSGDSKDVFGWKNPNTGKIEYKHIYSAGEKGEWSGPKKLPYVKGMSKEFLDEHPEYVKQVKEYQNLSDKER